MRKAEKSNARRSLHAVKVTDEPTAGSPPRVVVAPPPAPDPEVPATARRRVFTAEFKRQVLAEADGAGPGEIGAVLRRHGLYSSHLTSWRHQRDVGELAGLAPKKRGRRPAVENPLAEDNARLERENRRLLARAERAERLVALQKKLAELLGETLPSEEELLAQEEPPDPKPTAPRPRRRR